MGTEKERDERMKKRWSALIVGLLLAFSSISVSAEDQSRLPYEQLDLQIRYVSVLEAGVAGESTAGIKPYALQTYEGSYGNQLEGNSKTIYQELEKQLEENPDAEQIEISLPRPIIFSGRIEVTPEGNFVVPDPGEQGIAQAMTAAQSAFAAYIYDFPKRFWLSQVEIRLIGLEVVEMETMTSGLFKASQIVLVPKEYYEGARECSAVFEKGIQDAEAELQAMFLPSDTNYEKGRKIHDWICERVSYNYDAIENTEENMYAHTPYGVFVGENNQVVCEGYSKAFKILCDVFHIPCAIIVGKGYAGEGLEGGGHMWNSVQMPDNKWYGVDVTWDDSDHTIRDVYYAAGSETKGYGMTYGAEHEEDAYFTLPNCQAFIYPVIEAQKYEKLSVLKGDIDQDNAVNVNDLMYMMQVLSERISVSALTERQLTAGDVWGNDHAVTMDDLMKLLQFVSERIGTL